MLRLIAVGEILFFLTVAPGAELSTRVGSYRTTTGSRRLSLTSFRQRVFA